MGKKKKSQKKEHNHPILFLQPCTICPPALAPKPRGGEDRGSLCQGRAPCVFFTPLQWMRARWTSDPCYAFFGVDGTECSFLIYLSEVEWFCPPLPWRNQTAAAPSPPPPPRAQVKLGTPGGM